MAEENQSAQAEPLEGYSQLSTSEIIEKLDGLDTDGLIAVKEYEEENYDPPRVEVIEAVDAKLQDHVEEPESDAEQSDEAASSEESSEEGSEESSDPLPDDADTAADVPPAEDQPPAESGDQAQQDDTLPEDADSAADVPPAEDGPPPATTEPPSDGDASEAPAPDDSPEEQEVPDDVPSEETSEGETPKEPEVVEEETQPGEEASEGAPGTPDGPPDEEETSEGTVDTESGEVVEDNDEPTDGVPELNPGYAEERDPVDAARDQESPNSSAPDDFAQRVSAATEAAEPIRQEALEADADRPETQIQHAQASAAADASEQFPPDEPDAADLVAKRDEETDQAEEENREAAEEAVEELEGDDAFIAQAKSTAPPEIDLMEETETSTPSASTYQVGFRVSRQDRAIEEIGVIVYRHEPYEAGLVDVEFPESGTQTLNVANLRFEGDPLTDQEKQRQFEEAESRAF